MDAVLSGIHKTNFLSLVRVSISSVKDFNSLLNQHSLVFPDAPPMAIYCLLMECGSVRLGFQLACYFKQHNYKLSKTVHHFTMSATFTLLPPCSK